MSRHDDAWLEATLRTARSPSLVDGGFSAAVLERVVMRPIALAPATALAALRRAQDRERTTARWTIAGTALGALVATLVGAQGLAGAADPAPMLMPGLALLVASSVMAWLAIARH